MSAEQNIETARQMYRAFGRGDVQAILDRVTDDVDWSTDAAIWSAPWYGPRHCSHPPRACLIWDTRGAPPRRSGPPRSTGVRAIMSYAACGECGARR